MNRNDLIKAAKELNAVMELDPAIVVTTKAKDVDLKAGITKASKLITEDDEFSDKTIAILEEMGLMEGEEVEEEEEEEEEEAPAPKAKKGKKAKKATPAEDDDEEEAPAPKPKKVKVGMTRLDAVCKALNAKKAPKTMEAWAEAADALYEDAGGKANLKETKDDVRRVSKMAPHFDIDIPTK